MAKKKTKNINQMKEALLSNAVFIKGNEDEVVAPIVPPVAESVIEEETLDKFEALAAFEKTDAKVLIAKALNHFLKLKGLQLEQALKARENK